MKESGLLDKIVAKHTTLRHDKECETLGEVPSVGLMNVVSAFAILAVGELCGLLLLLLEMKIWENTVFPRIT